MFSDARERTGSPVVPFDPDRPAVEAARRDPLRFETLYRRYVAQIYGFALYETRDHHAAEDLTEQVFMQALAALPTVHAKLSFIPTGSAEEYPFRDMHPPCLDVIKAFGPERCVWGSDFPCELWCPKVTYAKHLRIFTHELGLDAATKRQILCETPRKLGFGDRKSTRLNSSHRT